MKKLNAIVQGTVGLLALGSVAVHAQEIQTVEIEGTVDNWYNYYYENVAPELLNAATFKFVVEQDIAATPNYVYDYSAYQEKNYNQSLQSLTFTFYDSEGLEIQTTATTQLTAGEFDYNRVWARKGSDEGEYYSDYMQWWGEDYSNESEQYRFLGGYIVNNNSQTEMFSDFTNYPLLLDLQEPGFQFYGWLNSDDMYYNYQEFWGTVTSIVSYYPDDDEDGFPNNVDSCPVSIMDETVMFDGWYDSGVTNYVDESGCTITDHYAACEVEEEPVRGIRSVRSGPSSCEKAVSYDLVADGVISYSEARALREALYNSSTSDGRR